MQHLVTEKEVILVEHLHMNVTSHHVFSCDVPGILRVCASESVCTHSPVSCFHCLMVKSREVLKTEEAFLLDPTLSGEVWSMGSDDKNIREKRWISLVVRLIVCAVFSGESGDNCEEDMQSPPHTTWHDDILVHIAWCSLLFTTRFTALACPINGCCVFSFQL